MSRQGAAYNAMMEDESKEGLASMLCDSFDTQRELRAEIATLKAALEKANSEIAWLQDARLFTEKE